MSSLERLEGILKGYKLPILALTGWLVQVPAHSMGTVSWGMQLHFPDQACGAGGRLLMFSLRALIPGRWAAYRRQKHIHFRFHM